MCYSLFDANFTSCILTLLSPSSCVYRVVSVTSVFKFSHMLCLPPLSDQSVFLELWILPDLVCFVCLIVACCVWPSSGVCIKELVLWTWHFWLVPESHCIWVL